MKRLCSTCRRERDLRAFDLHVDASAPCRECSRTVAEVRAREERALRRAAALAKIKGLKNERRSCIAAIMRLDAQALAANAPVSKRAAQQQERLSYLTLLQKVDAQITLLNAALHPSAADLHVQVD